MLKYSEELHQRSRIVVSGIKEYDGGTEDLTMDEMAIINHYETLLNDHPVINTEAVMETARKLDGVTYQLEFIRNYFDLLSIIHKTNHNHENLMGLHMSLFNDGALSSLDEMIKRISETINDSYVELATAIGEE